MKQNQKGFSLAISMGLLIVIFLMCMASLSVLISSTRVSGSVYNKDITSSVAESGIQRATIPLLMDGANNFTTIMGDQAGDVITGQINYQFAGQITYDVSIRDNDDLDGNIDVDTDKRIIVTSFAEIPGAGETGLEVYMEYLGVEDEYDQDTRTASSGSDYRQATKPALDWRATSN